MKTEKKGWFAFAFILAMFGILTGVLQNSSREKLHQLALHREASSHVSTLENFRTQVEGEFLEEDLLFMDLGMEDLVHSEKDYLCLLYTSPSPRDVEESRMPSSA